MLDPQDPVREILALLRDARSESSSGEAVCGIIYTLKRDTADEVAATLSSNGALCSSRRAQSVTVTLDGRCAE